MPRLLPLILFLILSATACQLDEKQTIPQIDQSLILADDLLWDLDKLQQIPDFEYLDSSSGVREILFDGPDYQGKPTKVFAYYSNPDLLMKRTNRRSQFPGVVLISGGSQPALRDWVERWAWEGFAAICCDYGNTRQADNAGPAPRSTEEIQALIYDSIAQGPKAVRAFRTASIAILAHSLLLSLPEVEKNKTVVTGISWGGFQTGIVSGLDNRFKAAALVYGSAFHDEIIFNRNFSGLTKEQVDCWMNQIDPKNYLIYSTCPTLFVTGKNDGCFDLPAFSKTTKLVPAENRFIKITPTMRHSHPDGWKPPEIAAFFKAVVQNGIPLPKVSAAQETDTAITFRYQSTMTLKSATLYYSNDTLSINADRLWESIPAAIRDTCVTASYPGEPFKYAFLYVTDVMGLGASSELLVHKP